MSRTVLFFIIIVFSCLSSASDVDERLERIERKLIDIEDKLDPLIPCEFESDGALLPGYPRYNVIDGKARSDGSSLGRSYEVKVLKTGIVMDLYNYNGSRLIESNAKMAIVKVYERACAPFDETVFMNEKYLVLK